MVITGLESGWSRCGSDGLGEIQVSNSYSLVSGRDARDKLIQTSQTSVSSSAKRRAKFNTRILFGNFCGLMGWKYFGAGCAAV